MPWDISSERSVYLQLVDIIKQKILSGEYKPGQRMESVRELAAEAAVNPNTMQRALAELEREGLLYTNRTSGRFVSEDALRIDDLRTDNAYSRTKEFYSEMMRSGFSAEEVKKLLERVISEEEQK